MKSINAMSKKKEATAKKIIAAIKSEKGRLANAAKKAGLNYSTVWRYAQDFPSVKEAVEEAKETVKDFVESRLYERIKAGDTTAIIFFLKTQAKDRGYVERQEQQQVGDVTWKVVWDEMPERPEKARSPLENSESLDIENGQGFLT